MLNAIYTFSPFDDYIDKNNKSKTKLNTYYIVAIQHKIYMDN